MGGSYFHVPLRTVKTVFSDVLSIFNEGKEIYLSALGSEASSRLRLDLADTSAGFSELTGCFYLFIDFKESLVNMMKLGFSKVSALCHSRWILVISASAEISWNHPGLPQL